MLRSQVPLGVSLKMHARIHPIAPTRQTLAHPQRRHPWPRRGGGRPGAQEIARVLMLGRKRQQRAKEYGRQRMIALSEAVQALEKVHQLMVRRVPENPQKGALTLP